MILTVTKFFVNRLTEIERLNSALHSDGPEKDFLVLLYGQHGIGKTELLAKYLNLVSNLDNLRIAYVDLRNRDYLGLISEIVEGLGKTGFEELERTYDAILAQFQVEQTTIERLQQQLGISQSTQQIGETAGVSFNGPVTAGRDQFFINGAVTIQDPKIENIFNINLREPKNVEELNQSRITLAFQSCLSEIAKTQPIMLLLDHWDSATDPLKIWLNDHLLKWLSQYKLRKTLIVLSQVCLPQEFEDRLGIVPLVIPPFNRDVALEFWKKNGLVEEEFNTIGVETYSIPGVLKLEVGKRGFGRLNR